MGTKPWRVRKGRWLGTVSIFATTIRTTTHTDDHRVASATVEEYITMVAAGLAASTPHMISATITALSRLMFEYQSESDQARFRSDSESHLSTPSDDLPRSMLDEMVATIVVFVGSKNREIVKSALGFVKVAVVSLPEGVLRPQLGTLVPALLGWVHDHKNHFKDKTVHIFERMIRKFGYDDIYRNSGEGDEKKVLEHIKKRKDRAKRQKIARAQNGDQEDDEVRSWSCRVSMSLD
jgi:ribosomal RNA-processing protein 12